MLTADLTIAYYPMDKSPPSPLGTFCFNMSPYYKFHVHIRRYDIDDVGVPWKLDLTLVTT